MGSNLGSENENILVKFGGYQSSYRPKLPTEVIDHGDLFESKQITSIIFFWIHLDVLRCTVVALYRFGLLLNRQPLFIDGMVSNLVGVASNLGGVASNLL